MRQKNVRVLVVDDSAFVRETLTTELRKVPAIDGVGSAGDPYEASEMLMRLQPDVMTLDERGLWDASGGEENGRSRAGVAADEHWFPHCEAARKKQKLEARQS